MSKKTYTVEFHPLSKRHYAKVNGKYIWKRFASDVFSLEDDANRGSDFSSEKEAIDLLKMYKEHQEGEGVTSKEIEL